MIRLLIQYAFLICALLNISFSNAQTFFNKVNDFEDATESAFSILNVKDGYVFRGEGQYSVNNGWRSLRFIKTDINGNIIWNKIYGKEGERWYSRVGAMTNVSEGNYLMTGGVFYSISNQRDALLIKFDENGDTLFTKHYGGNKDDEFSSVRQMDDGSIYLHGYTLSYGDLNGDYFLVKTDSIGNELWYKTYGTNSSVERGASIDITTDNNLILSGGTDKFSSKPYAPWLIKTDTSGNIIWDKHVGTQNGNDCGGYTIALIEGGYVTIGCIDTLGLPLPDGYVDQIVKTDAGGSILWRRVLPNNPKSFLRRTKELQDGTLLFAGEIWNTTEGRYTGYLIKYDANGNLLWERKPTYTESSSLNQGPCVIYDFVETQDNYIVCAGSAFGTGSGSDFWLLKLDEYGCEIPGCHVGINEQEVNNTSILAFPNPANEHTTVAVKLHSINAHKTISITCYDTQGKTIYTTTATLNSSGYVEQNINTATWRSGMYYYTVNTGSEKVGKGKIVIK